MASPYDFCGGDPIANVDPDGRTFGRWLAQNEQTVVMTTLAVAAIVASYGAATPAVTAIAISSGVVMGGLNVAYQGGDMGQVIAGAIVGGAVAGATLGAASVMGNFLSTAAGAIVGGTVLGMGAGVASTGLTNLIMGRSFEEGLLQAAVVGGATGFLLSAADVAYAKLKAGNSATGATEASPSGSEPRLSMKERMQQMMEALGMNPVGDTGPGLSYGGPGKAVATGATNNGPAGVMLEPVVVTAKLAPKLNWFEIAGYVLDITFVAIDIATIPSGEAVAMVAGRRAAWSGFRNAAKTSTSLVKTGTQFSKHSLERLAQRGVTQDMAELAISKGQKFYDPLNKSINYVLPNGFASGKSLLVGTNPLTGQVTTVLRSSKNLINSRFIPIK